MELNRAETRSPHLGLLDRFRQSWFPPAAVVGALSAFVAAAFRVRPVQKTTQPSTGTAPAGPVSAQKPLVAAAARFYDREYSPSAVVAGKGSARPFHNSLSGIALDSGARIYALGDGEIRVFAADGGFIRNWQAPDNASCLAVDAAGRVYVGAAGQVVIFSGNGARVGGFAAGEAGKPAGITSIKVFRGEILVADATARYIRRYDSSGKQLGEIGTQSKSRRFMLPNRSLDFDVDAHGVVRAGDSGRHRVTAWALDGSPLGFFGKFGQINPEDFTGCCNPVNVAMTHDGNVVTAEKAGTRVKIFAPEGKLLAVIGPEHFDPDCTHLCLAVDAKGRIFAADPVRREIKVFSLSGKMG